MVRSELSNTSSTVACDTGLRADEPEKITSVSESPRRRLAALSPITQRIASMMLDLPQPFGPTMPVMLVGRCSVVGSTKDLKPDSLIVDRRMRRRDASARPRGRDCVGLRIWIRFRRQVFDSTWRGTGGLEQSLSITARGRLQAAVAVRFLPRSRLAKTGRVAAGGWRALFPILQLAGVRFAPGDCPPSRAMEEIEMTTRRMAAVAGV